ncbi:autotransporter outer membrane beta-barrel domain-containing protein, partial [Helicobacter kayseriensis]|uniref:autotransporter outer membrane beta-barrel domain-containing protein n=1 Tax=Helicobacter kayseriensis TaxID=2905877 RepID=UPI001E5A0BDF
MISTYQLYLANLNSLNKRMGELRDNDKANGVWLRVFNGKQTVDFGVETQSTYTTIQGGYDSNFGGKDSNFYLGFALSYSNALSDFSSPNQAQNSVILSNNANGMEAGIYAAYVADSGLYTDTVAKFSFISNDFKSNKNENYKPRVLGGTLSQEVGYRFKLPLNFFIDPQGELSLGYLGGQSFTQSADGSFLQTSQDGIFTLRGRLGVNWGFDFQEFTQDKEMNAKLYLGTYYVGDYIHGGSITFDNLVDFSDKTNKYSSSGAFLLNVGTNISLKDHTRLYLDFEKSFGGKIRTDYQVNVGVRYSFGEKVRQQEATPLPAPQALSEKKSS